MATYRYIIRADEKTIRERFPELLQAITIWRELGMFNSQEIAILFNIPLKAANRVWLYSLREYEEITFDDEEV
jgi:hypothetical protein